MAGVNPFLAASVAMLLALIIPGWVAMRATITERLVAVQLGSVITALTLVCLSLGFGQTSFLDIAVAITVLSLPGTLVLTIFLERWL